jgi:hypothetical protein
MTAQKPCQHTGQVFAIYWDSLNRASMGKSSVEDLECDIALL